MHLELLRAFLQHANTDVWGWFGVKSMCECGISNQHFCQVVEVPLCPANQAGYTWTACATRRSLGTLSVVPKRRTDSSAAV